MKPPRPRRPLLRAYWTFAKERHDVFEARLGGTEPPWTKDKTLQTYRFCNAFRAADRVSQHLIHHAAYGDAASTEEDLFLRVLLHRLFSRPSTWELLEREGGPIRAKTFDPERYGAVLDAAFARGEKLYTAAFILCASSSFGHQRKHRNHLALIDAMLSDGVPKRIAESPSLRDVFTELRGWPLLGDFMSYQLAIDLNYSPLIDFSEDDFTVPGPGAVRGLRKVFVSLGDFSPSDAIRWLVEQQDAAREDYGVEPPRLFGRRLHAIDCQNLLCEVDKYSREAFPQLASNRQRIKQRFRVDGSPINLFFPPSWGINGRIPLDRRARVHDPAPV